MGRTAKLCVKWKRNGKAYISGLWIADPASPTGKRRHRPQFDTKQDAQDEIEKITRRQKEEGFSASRLTNDDRIDATRAKTILEPYKVTMEEAAKHYAQHLETTRRSIQFTDLCDEFFAIKQREIEVDAEGHWTPEDFRDTKSRCYKFAEKFGDKWVAEITVNDIHNWLEEQKLECSAQNRKNHRKALSKVFAFAKTKTYCPVNPVRDVPGIKVPKKRPAILKPKQIQKLLNGAPDELVPYIALGAFAGLRPSEAQRFRWQDLRQDGQLVVREDEDGADRHVDISTNLAAWLAPFKKRRGDVSPPEADRKAADLARDLKVIRSIWPQDLLRHSFGTAHACYYRRIQDTAFQMGNSVPTVKAKYLNAIPKAVALNWWQVMPEGQRLIATPLVAAVDPQKAFATDTIS